MEHGSSEKGIGKVIGYCLEEGALARGADRVGGTRPLYSLSASEVSGLRKH